MMAAQQLGSLAARKDKKTKHEGQRFGCTVGASLRSGNPRACASLQAQVLGEGTEVKTTSIAAP